MDIGTFLLLAGAGMIGGICNAVAGGGTFFTFPALLAAGVPPVVANATSAVSIWPGHASSLLGYRSELGRHRAALRRSLPVVGAGSLVGATLLVFTGDRTVQPSGAVADPRSRPFCSPWDPGCARPSSGMLAVRCRTWRLRGRSS